MNTLGALGNSFSNSEKVKKVIRSLPKEWRPKRTGIEEGKDLNILPIDDLIGSFIFYEEDMIAEKGNDEKKKALLSKPRNMRVMRKASWMRRRWICWLGGSENVLRNPVSKENLETSRTERRRRK